MAYAPGNQIISTNKKECKIWDVGTGKVIPSELDNPFKSLKGGKNLKAKNTFFQKWPVFPLPLVAAFD